MSSSASIPPTENYLTIEECSTKTTMKNNTIGHFFRRYWDTAVTELHIFFTFNPKEWLSAFRRNSKYPILVRGDIDGLVALFIDNMATLVNYYYTSIRSKL
ncbi:unnamed protein product [Rotaria magnacalcarata]|uniref:Uncharacterized protein n=1 Tax=Rotaria magnacalcarata TaxID=392030 RepID=A0A816VFX8_9BILA|nr:unnamed protein product [Rotaria magnacalcarata]